MKTKRKFLISFHLSVSHQINQMLNCLWCIAFGNSPNDKIVTKIEVD